MIVDGELERNRVNAVVACYKVIPDYEFVRVDKNEENF